MSKQPSRKKAVIIQTVGGYINTVLSIVQGLLLLPLYLKYIDVSLYGYWITVGSILALISIVNFGIGTVVMQMISSSYAKNDFQKLSDYFINSLILYLIISIVFIIVSIIVSLIIKGSLTMDAEQVDLLATAYYIAMFTTVTTFFNNSLRGFSQSLLKPLFGIYSTIIARIIGIVLVILLLINGVGLLSIAISLLVIELLIFISNGIYVSYQYRELKTVSRYNKNIIMEYLQISPHLFGLMVGNVLSNNSHPLIITTFLGAEITTAYTVTRKAVDIILQMLNVLQSSLIAPFAHLVGENNPTKVRDVALKIILYSFLMSIVMFGVYIASNYTFVNIWIGESIVLDQEVIFFIGLGALVYSMTRLLRSLLFGLNQFKFTSNMILLEGIIFTLLAISLIKFVGVLGIAVALFVVSSIISLVLLNRLKKEVNLKFSMNEILKVMALTIVVLVASGESNLFEYGDNSYLVFFIKALLSILSSVLIFFILYFKKIILIIRNYRRN